jgi:hypothetical protein
MNARSLSPVLCAIVAMVLAACSGDTSMPTDPAQGNALNRGPAGEQSGYNWGHSGDGSWGNSGTGNYGNPYGPGGSPPPGGSGSPGGPTGEEPGGGSSGNPTGEPVTRTLTEFLKMQGSFCAPDGAGGCQLYAAPVGNFLTWFDQGTGNTIAVDYAGLMSDWLQQNGGPFYGTTLNGTVTEEPLGDGNSRVRIELDVANALSFAVKGPDLRGALAFGGRVQELIDPSFQPGVGHLHMSIELINPTGAPLPDLVQLIREPHTGQNLTRVVIDYNGTGFDYSNGMEQGRRANIFLHYDESMGPIFPHNPIAPGSTGPTGHAIANIVPQ